MLNKIEQNFIFPVLRISSIVIIFLIGVSSIFIMLPESKPAKIQYSDVQDALETKKTNVDKDYKWSKTFNEFDNDNKKIIKTWIENLDPKYQQDFVNGLEGIVKKSLKKTNRLPLISLTNIKIWN